MCIFGKDNARKCRGDDLGSIGVNGRIGADNPGIGTDADAGADDLGTAADNSSTATDDLGIAADNSGIAANDPGIAADNPGTETDADTIKNDPGIAVVDQSIGMDADAEANNPSTTTSNKARTCTASLFALRSALFLLASSFESVTASLPSSLPSSSSTTLRSKPVLSCLITSIKQGAPSSRYPVDEMWRPSHSKVSSGMSVVLRFLYFLTKYS